MRCAVVRTLVVMLVIGGFGNELFEKTLQIASRGGGGVFHRGEAATRMLHENRDGPIRDTRLRDGFLHFISDFVSAFATCAHFQGLVSDRHNHNVGDAIGVASK
jgi:hypothetical protein